MPVVNLLLLIMLFNHNMVEVKIVEVVVLSDHSRHGSSTNQPSTPVKMVASKPQVYEEANGVDPPTQTRPSSLPHKLSQHASPPAPELSHASDLGVDVPDVGGDTAGENGTTAPTPEEVPGKLDLKFHHTHLW